MPLFTALKIYRTLSRSVLFILLALFLSACQPDLEDKLLAEPAFDATTLNRLKHTQALNLEQIYQQLDLQAQAQNIYSYANPYTPPAALSFFDCLKNPNCRYASLNPLSTALSFPAQRVVYNWQQRTLAAENDQVCGIKFSNAQQTQYQLRTFTNLTQLQQSDGYILSHYQQCGACSTLQDLAIFGEKDLTAMARTCSKRLEPQARLACMKQIGLTPMCATAWAYNSANTAQHCALQCVATYGLINILLNTEDAPNTDAQGNLNACLYCDELISGPGFQYFSGRTRRNSGISSEIDRPDDSVYVVPHKYFQ